LAEVVYEGMFLLDSNRYARNPEGVADQIPRIIQQAGGHMLVSRLWEERRLAFPIRGRRKGTYWLTYFRIDGTKLPEVNRECQLSDSILRVLFVKIDARIVDALVEHARTGQVKSAAEPADKKDKDKDTETTEESDAEKKQEKKEASVSEANKVDQPASEPGLD